MKDQPQFTAELSKVLGDLKKKYDATHDDVVKIVGYALDHIKYTLPVAEPPKKPSSPAAQVPVAPATPAKQSL